jgi:peptidoglycan/xylan/chitin deacetylase (PgdA/CDA1 family)
MIQAGPSFCKTSPTQPAKNGWLKNVLFSVARSDGAALLLRPFLRRSWRRSVNVLCYHYVGNPKPHYSAFYRGCTAAKLTQDLQNLERTFDFVSLDEVVAAEPEHTPRRPRLAITFDDGLDLSRDGAMEVFGRFGVKATTFVITSVVGNRTLMWRHWLSAIQSLVPELVWRREYQELAMSYGFPSLLENQTLLQGTYHQWPMNRKDEWASELWDRCKLPPIEDYLAETKPYYDWDGLQAWLAAGHSIGFHTHTHPFCSRLTPEEQEKELLEPAAQLKQRLGLDHLYLSYPFGDRLPRSSEHKLFESGLFRAFFGIGGLARSGISRERLERLCVEGFDVEKQLRSERLCAFRRQLLRRGHENEYPVG